VAQPLSLFYEVRTTPAEGFGFSGKGPKGSIRFQVSLECAAPCDDDGGGGGGDDGGDDGDGGAGVGGHAAAAAVGSDDDEPHRFTGMSHPLLFGNASAGSGSGAVPAAAAMAGLGEVSPKRLLDESPWLQFTSNASRFDPHRASISSRSGQVLLPLRVFESHTKLIRGEIAVSPPGGGGWGGGCKLVLCWDNVQSLWREKELWYKVALVPSAEVTRPAGWQPPAPNQRIDWRTDPQVWAGPPSIQISGFLTAYGRSC
jgi:hypothetical protein